MALKKMEKAPDLSTWYKNDEAFHNLYSIDTRALAKKHFTPLAIAEKVTAFLAAEKSGTILDIGSGAGKFCLAAAYYQPEYQFVGVEQRPGMVAEAENAMDTLQLKNVRFITGDFAALDFNDYNHFYFYNSFFENISPGEAIDDTIACAPALYKKYTKQLHDKLIALPSGTRIATYHSSGYEMPDSYYVVHSSSDDVLKFYIKL